MTSSNIRPIELDAFTFPLYGKRLIEASAGTGKTYTIANLYLRLLLPVATEQDFERPLTVDQILVVTFTEAATAELKARIYKRIRQARKVLLRAEDDGFMSRLQQEDLFLYQLANSMSAEQIATGIEYLLYAEQQMDEAAIFTIHGFCQRILSQNAFESRMLFQQSIETDEKVPLSLAVKDVWRSNIYPMPTAMAALVKKIWPTPVALQKEMSLLQSQPDVLIERNTTQEIGEAEQLSLEEQIQQAQICLTEVRQTWLQQASSILEAMNNSGLDGRFWAVKKQEQVAQTMLAWAQADDFRLPDELKKFNADEQANRLKKNGQLPQHDFFDQVARLYRLFPSAASMQADLLADLWQQVQSRLQQWRQQTQALTFTDLLTSLDHALSLESQYPLSARVRQLYPFAMIDEFQDTDPVQYRIFSQIYGPASDDNKQLGLVMIGDPKQAIYAFRGADIYTYLTAKQQVDEVYSLGTNYRSSAAMIQSVNGLFVGMKHSAENEKPQPSPFQVKDIPFLPVQDRQTAGAFYRHGQVESAMQFLYGEDVLTEEGVFSPSQYQTDMAKHMGRHIAELLRDAANGDALLDDRPVESGDIAVLVSGYRQAQLMKAALRQHCIASVYLSDRGSVFATNEARDLLVILHAVINHSPAHQSKEVLVRSALATQLLGWSIGELDELNQDDILYDEWVEKFRHYYRLWDELGILPMLRALIRDIQIAQKLLAGPQGERRLTDLLHLGEKLQQQSIELESKEGLIRYLTLAIQQPNEGSDEQQIRLETDDELVRIITIHKSKGLEYPIVYLPFACTPFRNKDKHALYHAKKTSSTNKESSQQLHYMPVPEEEQKQRHEAELYANEIRLAYVALTRAREVCYLGCAQVGKAATAKKPAQLTLHLSGVGALLCEMATLEAGELHTRLQQWLSAYPAPIMSASCLVDESDASVVAAMSNEQVASHAYQAKSFTGHIERDWWVGSYSSLVVQPTVESGASESDSNSPINDAQTAERRLDTTEPGLDEFTRLTKDDDVIPVAQNEPINTELEALFPSPFTFPKGAEAGTFLHDLLEGKGLPDKLEVSFADLLKTQHQPALIQYMEGRNYSDWQTVLFPWLQQMLTTPLLLEQEGEEASVCLRDLSVQQCEKEMEFFLPVAGMNARQLDQIARQHDELSAKAPPIQEQSCKGMLKGFIDLLFEHEGKYYVLDYKSNHLGMSLQDYHQDAMAQAMAEHRYDLQYQLYTLALHRFLSQRLPNYDYDQHIGGVRYLFLRGLAGANNTDGTGVFATRLSKEHVLALDTLFHGNAADKEVKAALPDNKKVASKPVDQTDDQQAGGGQYDLF